MNTKKEILYSITGILAIAAMIAFCILCPWSSLVWFVMWCLTTLAWIILYTRYAEAKRIINKLTQEYTSTLVRMGEITAYANVMSQANEHEKDETAEKEENSDTGGESED